MTRAILSANPGGDAGPAADASPEVSAEPGLLEGALEIAADAYPGLDRDLQRRRIDELAEPLLQQDVSTLSAPAQAMALAAHLRHDCGFRGNETDYYRPDNSFINRVLDTRLGIPISLAVIYIEVATRAGVRASGVGFPGHFLVRIEDAVDVVLVDPFSSRALSRTDLEALLAAATAGKLELEESMLEPTPTRHVIARMLFNLRNIYARQADHQHLLVTLDRLVDILPEALEHRRDRGLLCAELGAVAAARVDLDRYLRDLPHAPDAAEIQRVLAQLPEPTPSTLN